MSKSNAEDHEKTFRDTVDDYLQSLYGLQAFLHSALWDDTKRELRGNGRSSTQRRMTPTKGENPHDQKPDGVVQVSNEYGIVVEMKKHFIDDKTEHFDQVMKYDQDLVGWWTSDETISSYDLVLMTHYFSSTRALDAFKKWTEDGNKYAHPFAIVSFTYSDGAKSYLALQRVFGQLTDAIHDEALRGIKPVNMQVLKRIIADWKFYDAPPPVVHTMELLLDYVCPTLPKESEFDKTKGKHKVFVKMTVDEAIKYLSHYCPKPTDSRDCQLPRREWIEEALEELVYCRLATKFAGKPTFYQIGLRNKTGKKDTITYIAERIAFRENEGARKAATVSEAQFEIFGEPEETNAVNLDTLPDSTIKVRPKE